MDFVGYNIVAIIDHRLQNMSTSSQKNSQNYSTTSDSIEVVSVKMETKSATAETAERKVPPISDFPLAKDHTHHEQYQEMPASVPNKIIKEDDFLPLPPKQSSRSKYPPGCSVIYCQYKQADSDRPLMVSAVLYGKVEQVGINLNPSANRQENIYKVRLESDPFDTISERQQKTLCLSEDSLLFALRSQVGIAVPYQGSKKVWKNAIIVGLKHFPSKVESKDHQEDLIYYYSVQLVENNEVFHGIPSQDICFWPANAKYGQPQEEQDEAEATFYETEVDMTEDSIEFEYSPVRLPEERLKENEYCSPVRLPEERQEEADSSPIPLPEASLQENTEPEDKEPVVIEIDSSSSHCSPSASTHGSKGDSPEERNISESQEAGIKLSQAGTKPYACEKTEGTNTTEKDWIGAILENAEDDDSSFGEESVHWNTSPNLFKTIMVCPENDIRKALSKVTRRRRNNKNQSKVFNKHCLYYHVCGRCHLTCQRSHSHVPLTEVEALKVEKALSKAVGPKGPIFMLSDVSKVGHGADGEEDILCAEEDATKTLALSDMSALEVHVTDDLAIKNRMLEDDVPLDEYFVAVGKSPNQKDVTDRSPNNEFSLDYYIPAFVGWESVEQSIIGDKGVIHKETCRAHRCSMNFKTPRPQATSEQNFCLSITGRSIDSVFGCRQAVEHMLCSHIHSKAVNYFLYSSAQLNKHRQLVDKAVHVPRMGGYYTSNNNNNKTSFTWLVVVKYPFNKYHVNSSNRKEMLDYVRRMHARCKISYVEKVERHSKIPSHLVISCMDVQAVLLCQDQLVHELDELQRLFVKRRKKEGKQSGGTKKRKRTARAFSMDAVDENSE